MPSNPHPEQPLTRAQRDLLGEIAASKDGEMHLTGRHKLMADRLNRKGYLNWGPQGWYAITDAGRQVLRVN